MHAEIELVTIKWTAGLCQASCIRGLEQQFRRIQGVTNVKINGDQAQADLAWSPNAPFSFRAIEGAMAFIGLSMNDLRVTVRGTVRHDERSVILTSTGDLSQFVLMSPPPMSFNMYVEVNSPLNRELTPQVRSILLAAEQNQQTVVISGPLFHPETSPPLFLTVESVNVVQNASTENPRSRKSDRF
ncbi:MAG: hypothetical protein HWD61_12995 [Parachlamydiaceae bacterium]|nr:MAG: hypothetical protein HWD61_12995 [Parachlamydiaceae bacterium]